MHLKKASTRQRPRKTNQKLPWKRQEIIEGKKTKQKTFHKKIFSSPFKKIAQSIKQERKKKTNTGKENSSRKKNSQKGKNDGRNKNLMTSTK